MHIKRFIWLPAFLSAVVATACDRAVLIKGQIVSATGAATGDCTAQLLAHEIDGIDRQWAISHEFDEAVFVDPIRRLTYYVRIRCEACRDTYQSPDFVEGEVDFGTIMLMDCGG